MGSEMCIRDRSLYYVQTVGLNPFQLVLVGTTIEVSAFIFEVPTGVVADTYSRKLSIILGYLIMGVCYIIEGLFPIVWVIFAAEAALGLGYTFTSGALTAWLADEVGEEAMGRILLRTDQMIMVTSFLGIGLGVLSVSYTHLTLPTIYSV